MDALGNLKRTHHAGRVTAELTGQTVTVTGWVDRLRDHGGVYFIDLRDWTGIVVVFIPDVRGRFAGQGP